VSKTIGTYNYQDGFVDGTTPKDYIGRFITGRTVAMSASRYSTYADNTDVANLYTVGVVQGLAYSQAKQLQRIFELGSSENTIVPGRSVGTLQLSRVWYYGPNFLKVFYTGVSDDEIKALRGPIPGYEELFLNLSSGLYDNPCGLLLTIHSQGNALSTHDSKLVGQLFLENAYIQNHGIQMSAQAVVLAEQVSIQFERAIPVNPIS
jgi:hypothetical protein